jgi:hypothetical protein
MKRYVTKHNIATLARIAALCALAVLSVDLSPALAAMLSRGADFSITLSAMRSLIGPLCVVRDCLLPLGGCARSPVDQIISLL